jgi:hypothetical protein
MRSLLIPCFTLEIGTQVGVAFTAYSGTGEPAEIHFTPIVGGNITVDD